MDHTVVLGEGRISVERYGIVSLRLSRRHRGGRSRYIDFGGPPS